MTLSALIDFFLLNPLGYLSFILFFLVYIGLFWFIWCRERILLLGIFGSIIMSILYFFAISLISYRYNDPGSLTALQTIGFIEKHDALKRYTNSKYFHLNDERSLRVLSLLKPDKKALSRMIEADELIALLKNVNSMEIGRQASGLLDVLKPGWQDGKTGKQIGRDILKQLSEDKKAAFKNKIKIRYLVGLNMGSEILIEYLAIMTRSPIVGAQVASALDKLSPQWRKNYLGQFVSRSVALQLSNQKELTDDDRKHIIYLFSLKLRCDTVFDYLTARPTDKKLLKYGINSKDFAAPDKISFIGT